MVCNKENISGVIHILPGMKHPKLIIDYNDYSVSVKESGKTRWRCSGYFKTKCKSSLITYGKVVQINHGHNHPPLMQNKSLNNCLSQVVTIVRGSS